MGSLRHEMILPKPVEANFQELEKEYVARERLAHFGLKPSEDFILWSSWMWKEHGAERLAWNMGLPES